MSDPIAVVGQIAPPAEAPPELLERVRCELMATIIESETTTNTTTTNEPEATRARRRRLLSPPGEPGRRVAVAAAVLVMLAGAVVVIAGKDRQHDDVEVSPADTTATTTAPAASTHPDCTDADVDIVPADPDAPGATEGDTVTLRPTPDMQPCTLTLLTTQTYRDPTTGELLTDIEPNPIRELIGLIWGQPGQGPLTLGTFEGGSISTPEASDVQCRGIDAGVMYQVTTEFELVGFGPPSNYPGRDDVCTLDNP
jgi:hypothetical protein